MKKSSIVIAAGGTGGHFFPAKALAMQLRSRGYPIIFVTDKRINDTDLAQWDDVQQFVVEGGGISGKNILKRMQNILKIFQGVGQSYTFLKKETVSVMVGFGGYPSFAPLLASRAFSKKRRPALILHEGNACLGLANRILSKFASAIATSFPHVTGLDNDNRVVVTGLPVRPDITALYSSSYSPSKDFFNILVWGGSLGAKVFGELIPQALADLPIELRKKIRLTQQVRKEDIDRVSEYYKEIGIVAELAPFFKNVATLLNQAHLVIGRSGGSSIAELSLAKKPAILIPYPYAANNEQSLNAKAFAENGAGWVFEQSELTPAILTAQLTDLFTHPEKLVQAAASHHLAFPNAASDLADLVEKYVPSSS